MTKDERKRERVRQAQRDAAKAKILLWYVDNMLAPPEHQVHNVLPYGGKSFWYLMPPVPYLDNPVLIEECIGDGWALRVDILDLKKT